jgi:hypothetical protein
MIRFLFIRLFVIIDPPNVVEKRRDSIVTIKTIPIYLSLECLDSNASEAINVLIMLRQYIRQT